MTEVSRATSGLSSISSKKLPSFNNNGFPPSSSSSSSSKHIYDGVFSSQPSDKLKKSSEFCSFGDDDYGEIFGCSKSENGGPRQSSCSSIPMLDLPVFEPKGRVLKGGRGEGIDYSGIFGGVGNGDGVDDFDQLKKKAKTFSSGPIPRSNGQTTEATRSHISSQSQNSQAPTNGFSKSFDSVKHPEWKTNEMLANENGTAHVGLVHATHRSTRSFHGVSPDKIPTIRPRPVEPLGQVHATHGSSHPVQEVGPLKTQTSRSPVIKDDTEVAIDSHLANKGKHSRKTSSDVEPKDQKNELEAVSLEESDFSKSNLPATSPATHQASTEAGPSKVVNDDAETKFSVKDNINVSGPSDCSTSEQISETETSGAVSQKVSGSTVPNSLATSDMSCQASSTVEPAKVVKDDAKVSTSFDGGKRQGRHSRVTSLDLGENKQGLDARIHRKSRLGGSYSFDASHDPLAARVKLQPSKVVPSPSLPQFFPVESHCKISENSSCKSSEANGGAGVSSPSLDEQLDVNSAAAVSAAALQRAIEEAQMKIRLAKEFLEREGQGSTKLTFKDILKARVVEENTCVKEENKFRQNKVHENRSQVGQAEMKIHLAKELLEQEGQGSSKLSSKSTLKVKVVEENKHVNEVNELSQKNTNGNSAQVDSEMQSCSRLESKSVSGTAQFVPVLDTQEKIPRYEGPIEGKNAEASISIEEDDKREGGGEWEAAKHLNQLISGVRNRLFSFMAWPAETEKKEEPKEMEASGKWLGTEKKEPKEMEASVKWVETEKKEEPKETEASAKLVETEREEPKEMEASRESPEKSEAGEVELKETEDDQCATIQASETKPGEDKLGMVPEAIEPKEYESIRSGSTEQVQGKTGDKVDLVHTEESTRTNFLFFSFTGKRPWNHPEPEVEKEEQPQESREVETEVREEQMIDEVKDEWIQSKEGEANKEGLNDNCTSQSCEKSLSGFSSEQIDEMVEEPYSMVGHEENEFAQEVKSRMLDEELGDYKGSSTDEEDNDRRVNEECIYDTIKSSPEEDDGGRLNEECNDDASKVIHDEESGGTLDEELMHEVDIDRRLNEECCDDMRRPILEEDSDQRLNEEYDVDRSRLIQEEDSYQRLNEVLEYEKETHEFIEEEDRDGRLNEKQGEEPRDTSHCPQNIIESSGKDEEEYEVVKEAEAQTDDTQMLEEVNLVGEVGKTTEASGEIYGQQEDVSDQGSTNHIGEVARGMNSQEESDEGLTNHIEEVVDQMNGWEVNNSQTRTSHTEESTKEVADQMGSIGADYESHQTNTISLSEADKVCWIDESNREAEKAVFPVEERERMTEIINSTSQPEMDIELTILSDDESEEMMDVPEDFSETTQDLEEPVVFPKAGELFEEERVSSSFSNENPIEFNGIKHPVGTNGTLPFDNLVSHESETDVNYSGQKDIDIKATESKSEDDIDKQTEHLHESRETPNAEEAALASDAEGEKSSAEAVHRRRRWFDAGAAERPNILKGDGTSMEIDQEVLEEPDLAGSVEIHADDFGSEVTDVTTAREADTALTREGSQLNEEVTHKRKRWFVKKGEQGVPEPPNLFEGTKVTLEVNSEILKESLMQNMPGSCVDKLNVKSGDGLKVEEAYVVVDGGIEKQNVEATPRRKRWFESGEKVGPSQQLRSNEDAGTSVETNQEHKMRGETEKSAKLDNMPILEKDDVPHKAESVNRDLDAAHRRKKEKIAVERAIREARERAFAEARERARRDKPNVEAHRGGSAVEDRPAKVSSDASSADKASTEAKLKAERAAVERATAEARERALRKAMSEKATRRSGEQVGKHPLEKSSTMDPKHHSSRCSDFSNSEELDGADGESLQRRQARLERQQRTMERAAKALEEKNKRDLLAQKEQAARNMLADALDAEVKRWSTGKEGNLRALLSTLQYILGSDSGWQALSLTDLVAPTAVRKAYKKATLCVHPDKLQQRGATIQQKYICEKVFDLLKEAWGKFNPEER